MWMMLHTPLSIRLALIVGWFYWWRRAFRTFVSVRQHIKPKSVPLLDPSLFAYRMYAF